MAVPPAQTFPIAETDSDVVVQVGASLLRGWSFQETTGSAGAAVIVYDGDPSAGQIIVAITLSSGESTRDYPAQDGILVRTSAYLEVVSGSVQGALWLNPLIWSDDRAFAWGQSYPFYVRGGV